MTTASLQERLRRFGRRLLAVGVAAGTGWGITTAVILLLVCVWLDLLWELPPSMRIAGSVLALFASLLLIAAAAWLSVRRSAPRLLARRLDLVACSGGRILCGVDLSLEQRPASALSAGLAELAVRQAEDLANKVSGPRAVPARPAYWSFASVGGLSAALALAAVAMPRLASTQWLRFADPFGNHPPFSRIIYHVEPGDVQVVFGAGFDIRVTTEGAAVERVDLVLQNDGTAAAETLPLFPEPGGQWRATVVNVMSAGHYSIRSHAGRSREFRIDVVTVPRLEGVRFRITPPAYANLAPYEGPLPQGGIAGLKGTRVQLWAKSNRPLSGGSMEITGRDPLTLTPAGAEEATGTFELQKPGKLQVRIIDTAGQPSTDTFTAPITVLTDERPFIRLLQPQAMSLATPDTALPVVFAAEDDYGIARIQLFRSLNDSRALPLDVPVPMPARTRFSQTVVLPLAGYGLQPGDEIKLFARVEDNDPDGAKGSESTVAVVRIISQEDFEKMFRAREGMNVFLAKYRQAQRRIESLAEEADKLRKKAKEQPADSEAAKELRRELEKLAQKMEEVSEALRKSAQELLPYDLDKALSKRLEEMAQNVKRLSRQGKGLAAKSGLKSGELAKALEEMLENLADEQKMLEREAIEPLEFLASVLRLLEDSGRFVILYQRQQGLADRLQSLKGRDRQDDPALKSRMRDLQSEQEEIRTALGQLLDDIEEHVTQLPDDPKLEDLKKGALEFVRAVRPSGAAEAMADAEAGLGEFNGTRGYESARKAAQILEKFISKCQGMQGEGKVCLKFKPSLSSGLGDTVEQLLAEAGLLPGKGDGHGGGYSARRSSLDNVGLYGQLPGMDDMPRTGPSQTGQAGRPASGSSGRPGNQGQSAGNQGMAKQAGSGAADAAVPLPYRRRVAEYFQRIADDTGKK